MVAENQFGNIRKVMVEYPQGWLSTLTEKTETNKQLGELTQKSGMSGCMGDIGTHAAQLAEYISGLKLTQYALILTSLSKVLDDDGNVLLKFNNGANGILVASQIACGEENSLKLRFTEKRRFGMASNGTQYSTG
jgi:predicted dehydrogenase